MTDVKLTPAQRTLLERLVAGEPPGNVAGSIDDIHRLWDAGLLKAINSRTCALTDLGREVIANA